MFAVIRTGGKQYKVAENDVISVEKLAGETGDAVTLGDVLMLGDGASVTVGTPLVEGASVSAEVVEQRRAGKIIVFKKRRRHKSRVKNGHRQHETVLKILEIAGKGGAKKTAKKSEPKPEKAAEEKASEQKTTAPKKEAEKPAKKPAEAKAEPAGDVTLIGGVGPKLKEKLENAGVTSLEQIAAWTADDIARIDEKLDFKGRIERDDWVGQAKDLLAGKEPQAKADRKS